MKKNLYIYVFFVVAYLITLGVVRAAAFGSLDLCMANPALTEYSMFINLAVNR